MTATATAGAPADPLNALQSLVSRLRRLLPDPRLLESSASGYRLASRPRTSTRRVSKSSCGLGAPRCDGATRALPRQPCWSRRAALWRGSRSPTSTAPAFTQPYVSHLEQLRLGAQEDRREAALQLGRGAELVPRTRGAGRRRAAARACGRPAGTGAGGGGTPGRRAGRVRPHPDRPRRGARARPVTRAGRRPPVGADRLHACLAPRRSATTCRRRSPASSAATHELRSAGTPDGLQPAGHADGTGRRRQDPARDRRGRAATTCLPASGWWSWRPSAIPTTSRQPSSVPCRPARPTCSTRCPRRNGTP